LNKGRKQKKRKKRQKEWEKRKLKKRKKKKQNLEKSKLHLVCQFIFSFYYSFPSTLVLFRILSFVFIHPLSRFLVSLLSRASSFLALSLFVVPILFLFLSSSSLSFSLPFYLYPSLTFPFFLYLLLSSFLLLSPYPPYFMIFSCSFMLIFLMLSRFQNNLKINRSFN